MSLQAQSFDSPASQAGAIAPNGKPPPTQIGVELCDLVMKGGITSGIIYPKLISTLAPKYRFKNIGGTSAGAIAAGACAAAEYGRQHDNPKSFEMLDELPKMLSTPTPPTKRSRLFTLFQPSPALRGHFGVLIGTLNSDTSSKIRHVLFSLLKMHWFLVIIGLVLSGLVLSPLVGALCPQFGFLANVAMALFVPLLVLIGLMIVTATPGVWLGLLRWTVVIVLVATPMTILWLSGWAAFDLRLAGYGLAMEFLSLLVVGALLLAVAWRFVSTLLAGLHKNGYGICCGRTEPAGSKVTGLTDWLTGYFNELAGLSADRGPLTFGDLWGDPEKRLDGPRNINFEVMTTAVSQTMGYSIPFRAGTQRFYYNPDEWRRYFPPAVMDWLQKSVEEYPQGDSKEPYRSNERIVSADGVVLRALPRAADLPLVVAVRMSLSFPILLSAVPLYSVDWTRKATRASEDRIRALEKDGDTQTVVDFKAERVWFSDGGISSNMPLHFFDALLPEHPTFAINLKSVHPDYPITNQNDPSNAGGRIYLAEDNNSGRIRHWEAPNDKSAVGSVIGFLGDIVNTMQNWRDELLFPYPGFRDRIVQISQRPDEGGLNLDMPKPTIDSLASAGAMAATRLANRFYPTTGTAAAGWVNHQEVRLRTLLGTMQPAAESMNSSLASGLWQTRALGIPFRNAAQRQLANDFLLELRQISALGNGGTVSLESVAMKPVAQIRITPRI